MMTKIVIEGDQMDITAPEIVEVRVDRTGKILWINVDGVCRLRCCRMKNLIVEDSRKEGKTK